MSEPYGQAFNGKIKDVAIWNRLLDTEEVSQFSTLGIDGNENDQSLIGNWILIRVRAKYYMIIQEIKITLAIVGASWDLPLIAI